MWFRKKKLSRDQYVDGVMRSWPGATATFLAFGMKCIGCPIGAFHTVEEACEEHDVDLDRFLAALEKAAEAAHLDGDSASR
jgi:hybrid cluster-associated redox disulfide protein